MVASAAMHAAIPNSGWRGPRKVRDAKAPSRPVTTTTRETLRRKIIRLSVFIKPPESWDPCSYQVLSKVYPSDNFNQIFISNFTPMNSAENLEHIRHSLAHLLAAAVLDIYKEEDIKLAIGPAVENGFYYDIEFPTSVKIGEADLSNIESKMRQILPSWKKFERKEVTPDEAKSHFLGNHYKNELINEIVTKGEPITLYTSGQFTDLCRGGHAENFSEYDPGAFKLDKVTGAYWRGDEKNQMLTRIYGLAFSTKKELQDHLSMVEEAKKRDHKKLGPALDLFTFSDLVGSGLPLWTPKGTLVRDLLENYVWSLRKEQGYQKVEIPHITKKDLYEVSGHWDKFKDELFRITTREGHEFAMKPMNCPHHTQIYARKQHSYRELPQRYASTTMCYRDEQTGELAGLSRVRSFTQDDAHVFCRESQVKAELKTIWNIVQTFYHSFGFSLKVRLSLHDPTQPDKYLGDKERWKKAEAILQELAEEMHAETFIGLGEAAFYGPKLDFMAKDSIGREWQVATIQVDMNMPERFDLTCKNEESKDERIVMLHAAIMGSIERFLSVLIEHTAGAFPTWLAPVQVALLPISEKHVQYAESVKEKILAVLPDARIEIDANNESIGKKIREVIGKKIPYQAVVGDKEIESKTVAVKHRNGEDLGSISVNDFIQKLIEEIVTKK